MRSGRSWAAVVAVALGLGVSACVGKDAAAPQISDGLLREAVQALEEGREPPPGVQVIDSGILVEAVAAESEQAVVVAVERVGGTVRSSSPGLVLAVVPFRDLEELERDEAVDYLRNPLVIDVPP